MVAAATERGADIRQPLAVIEKGEAMVVFKNDASSDLAAHDFAEEAGRVGHFQ